MNGKRKLRLIDLALVPFAICVAFLLGLGKLFGLTYKQISVIFNLWIQGGVLAMSGLLPAVAFVYRFLGDNNAVWLIATICYLPIVAIYVYGFIWLLRHYHLPYDYAFDLCVADLETLAKKWHTTYHMVNIIIFILLFLLALSINITIGRLLMR